MKTVSTLILVVVALTIPWPGTCETWEQFRNAKAKAEQPDLIPKGDADLIPKKIIVERIKREGKITFSSNSILFDYGSAKIREDSFRQLKEIADAIKDPSLSGVPYFFVDGHTCNIGTDHNNCVLSWRRARGVIRFLTDVGDISRNKLIARGFGEHNPVASNSTEEERKRNRRVVLMSGSSAPAGDNRGECP